MTRIRQIFALGAVVSLMLAVAAGPALAQEYPPGEFNITCSATVVPAGSSVTCSTTGGPFAVNVSVTGTATSSAQTSGGGPVVANLGTALLAQGAGQPFTLTETVTSGSDGNATATFQIPDDAERGPVTVSFAGEAPDGSDQVVSEQNAFRVVAAQAADRDGRAGGLALTGANAGLWVGLAAALLILGGGTMYAAKRRRRIESGTADSG